MKGRTSTLTADRSEPNQSNIYRCRLISMFLFFGTARTFVRRSKGIKDASVFTLAERRGRRGSGLISTSSTSCSTNWIKMLTAAPAQHLRGARLRFFPVFRAAFPLRGPDVGNNATVKLQRKTVAGGENLTAPFWRRLTAEVDGRRRRRPRWATPVCSGSPAATGGSRP